MVTIKEFIQAKGYTKGNAGRNAIVVHYLNSPNSTAKNAALYFKDYGKASAHYIIGLMGEIYQCVNEKDTAYAVGTASGTYTQKDPTLTNGTTISIEMCHTEKGFNDVTINSCVNLIHDILKRWPSIKRVVRHYDVVNKVCPSFWVNDKIADADLHPVKNTENGILIDEWVVFQASCLNPPLRVRKTWEDPASQIAAYNYPRNAIALADAKGLNVYDNTGKCVYKAKLKDNIMDIRVDTKSKTFVKAIQTALVSKGYALPVYGIDGDFGSETTKAWKQFAGTTTITSAKLEELFK